MWKLLLIAFLARVSGAPLAPELPVINCFNLFGAAAGTYRCSPLPISSNQSGLPNDTNHLPMPFGFSNIGAILNQNFVFNGVVPSGHSNSDPPQAPKRADYTYTPGVGAHKLNIRPLTWNASRKACIQDGGHLAIINSEEEAQVLGRMLRNLRRENYTTLVHDVYLGIRDSHGDGHWVTIFGEPLASTGFESWPPDFELRRHGGNERCGIINATEDLDDYPCDLRLSYFCELTNV